MTLSELIVLLKSDTQTYLSETWAGVFKKWCTVHPFVLGVLNHLRQAGVPVPFPSGLESRDYWRASWTKSKGRGSVDLLVYNDRRLIVDVLDLDPFRWDRHRIEGFGLLEDPIYYTI